MPQTPAIGEDVTALMGGTVPAVGDDVSALMESGVPDEPRMASSHGTLPDDDGPSFADRLKDAAYRSSPLPLFERENLPGTMAGLTGAAATALTGGGALIPIAASALAGGGTRGVISAAEGKPIAQVAEDAGWEGAKQGALAAIGPALQRGGVRLMRGIMKPSSAITDSFGTADELAEAALQERAGVTRAGAERMDRATAASSDAVEQMVREAQAAGAPNISVREAAADFPKVLATARDRARLGVSDEAGQVVDRFNTLRSQNPGGLSVLDAQRLKKIAQEAAYGGRRQVGVNKAIESADDLINAAEAQGLQRGLESRIPGIGAQNRQTQRLMGATEAIRDAVTNAERSQVPTGWLTTGAALGMGGAAMAGPSGAAVGLIPLLTAALRNPTTGSQAAIAAYQAGRLNFNALVTALEAEFGDQ